MRFVFFFLSIFYIVKVYSDCENIKLVTDFVPNNCDKSQNEYYTESVNGLCIPGCYIRQGLHDVCVDDEFTPGLICAPGLICDEVDCTCEKDPADTSCAKTQHYDTPPKWVPDCLPDGSYAPKQCKGESQNGRCFCYDRLGKRIFGEAWSSKADTMTCACSRHRSELAFKGRNDVTLHCDSMGNYERLQCESGSCWCANPQTGEVEDSVLPESMMTLLPCYDRTQVGSTYLRKCESQAIAQSIIKDEFNTHGTTYVSLSFINCDWDGSYGRYKLDSGQVYCTWRDNTNLGSWAEQQSNIINVNCNCARDTRIYELSGKKFTKDCMGNGNYRKLQTYNATFSYCVDEDGFAITDPQEGLLEADCESQ